MLPLDKDLEASFPHLAVSYVVTTMLRPRKGQMRRHARSKIESLAKFMKASKFIMPIVINEGNEIVIGNARVMALSMLGFERIPVIRVTHLDEVMIRALVVADNQFCLNASWYKKELRQELQELMVVLPSYKIDILDLGFTTAELDFHIGDIGLSDPSEEVPEVAANQTPVTKPGNLWLLRQHKLICGDARHELVYQNLMRGQLAEMVFGDIPYNVPTEGHICGNGAIQHREFAMAAGEMSEQEFIAFMVVIFKLLRQFSADGSVHMQCMDWRHNYEILSAARHAGYTYMNMACWAKHLGGMGSLYRSQHELIHIFKSGDAPHINNVMLGKYGRNRTNLWQYEGANSFSNARKGDLALHPTVKPVDLVANALKDCSNRGGIILDPTAGSGSTLIAAEQTERVARLIEIDPLYCDVIIQRWQRQTGGKAVLEDTGETFDALSRKTEVSDAE